MIIHIFNPETDFAKGSMNARLYTPKKHIVELRRKFSLLVALLASPGDSVFFLDGIPDRGSISDEVARYFKDNDIIFCEESDLKNIIAISSDVVIKPWGWNPCLVDYLRKIGVPQTLLPSLDEMDQIRRLSHRRMTIAFHHLYGDSGFRIPVELDSSESVRYWLNNNPDSYFKAPWSSSGRGVQRSADMRYDKLMEWTGSVIRKQGSLLAETSSDKILDFATEWTCSGGKAQYLGISVFKTSGRGIYKGNIVSSQAMLSNYVAGFTAAWSEEVIKRQKTVIDILLSPYYNGDLGIDMLVDSRGMINPCVEINLRTTMGHVALEVSGRSFPGAVKEFISNSGLLWGLNMTRN